jgi:hypothetical protein
MRKTCDPFLAIHKRRLRSMTPSQIVAEAMRRGYTVRDAPAHYPVPGLLIGGSKAKRGSDGWMNDANVRLWKIQTQQLRPVSLADGTEIYV